MVAITGTWSGRTAFFRSYVALLRLGCLDEPSAHRRHHSARRARRSDCSKVAYVDSVSRASCVVRSGEGVEPPLDQLEDHDVDRCEVLELDAEVGAANGGRGLVADVAE